MSRKKTQHQFIQEITAKHSGRYDCSEVVYVSIKAPITVICKEHGRFSVTASHHLYRGQGCPTCSGKRFDTASSVEKAKQAHGNKYLYAKYEYVDCYHKTVVTCPVHGDWEVSHNEHVNSKSGCPKCAGKDATTESFADESSNLHCGLYTYENTVYKNNSTKVEVTCRKHGSFLIRPYDHKLGGGCPKCTKHGYCKGKPGHFYIMQSDSTVKIGITNKDVTIRAKKISRSAGKTFSVLLHIKFMDGSIAQAIEAVLLKELRQTHEMPDEVFDGSTECFVGVDYTKLLARVAQLASEYLPNYTE